MPKSKYPEQLDTSVEIPAVRDNITEIGSDVINSLRSAIFQVEKVLGINPQGSTGNTVANRISTSLDEQGNIKTEALEQANVLSGPISDNDVAKNAAISESKLNLNFSTHLLQDEISILNNLVQIITDRVAELGAILTAHVNTLASNRHPATAISVSSADALGTDVATLSLEENSLQTTLETIYNSHINYSGADISELNNSHQAKQIYYDNSQTQEFIFNNDLQNVIDDIVEIQTSGFRNNTLNLHSNGVIRKGQVLDAFEGNLQGSLLVASSTVTYGSLTGSSRTTIIFSDNPTPLDTINEFDILTLSGSTKEDDNKEYLISEVTLDLDGNIESITVYGGPTQESASDLFATVTKQTLVAYNSNGLNAVTRPRFDKTNTPDVQVANPNAATIISKNLDPTNITEDANVFSISIDGNSSVDISTFDSSASEQTIDTIINQINTQAVDNNYNFLSYKLKVGNCYELALSHNIPNHSGDIKNRTLKISTPSIDDGIEVLGFANSLDIQVEGSRGNAYHINGLILQEFGDIKTLDFTQANLVSGSLSISTSTESFVDLGIRIGDLLVITNSTDSADDGTYRVASVSEDILTLDESSNEFVGSLEDNSLIHIIRATAPIGELTFTEIVGDTGSILFDVFVTDEQDVHYRKRLEVEGALQTGTFSAAVIDISDGFIVEGEVAEITIDTNGLAVLTDPNLIDGPSVDVSASGIYKIFSPDGLSFVTLRVAAAAAPSTEVSVSLKGFDEIKTVQFRVCRGLFGTSLGIVFAETSDLGIPILIDKRTSGTADDSIVGNTFIEKYIEGPRNELRASGVIRGVEVSNLAQVDDYFTFDVSAGVIVVNGIRKEILGYIGIRANAEENFYIAIDADGCVITGDAIIDGPDDTSPFVNQEVVHLAFADIGDLLLTDLRFFIDKLDLKILGDVIVSTDQHSGHFTSIKDAVRYARKFISLYPERNHPSIFIQEGSYEITDSILIDFDLTIKGAGPNTLLRRAGSIANGQAGVGANLELSQSLFIIGGSETSSSSRINNGVTFENFSYRTSSSLAAPAMVFAITQEVDSGNSPNAMFRFNNLNLIGPSNLDQSQSPPIIEYGVVLTQSENSVNDIPSNLTMGNIIITNCKFDFIGDEESINTPKLDATCTLQNIVVSNNIVTNASPVLNSTSVDIIFTSGSFSTQDIIDFPNTGVSDAISESSSPSKNNPIATLEDLEGFDNRQKTHGFDIIKTTTGTSVKVTSGVLEVNDQFYIVDDNSSLDIDITDTFGADVLISDSWVYLYLKPGATTNDPPEGVVSVTGPDASMLHPSDSTHKFLASARLDSNTEFVPFIKSGNRVTKIANGFGSVTITSKITGSDETISPDMPSTAKSIIGKYRMVTKNTVTTGQSISIRIGTYGTLSTTGEDLYGTAPYSGDATRNIEFKFEIPFGSSQNILSNFDTNIYSSGSIRVAGYSEPRIR